MFLIAHIHKNRLPKSDDDFISDVELARTFLNKNHKNSLKKCFLQGWFLLKKSVNNFESMRRRVKNKNKTKTRPSKILAIYRKKKETSQDPIFNVMHLGKKNNNKKKKLDEWIKPGWCTHLMKDPV